MFNREIQPPEFKALAVVTRLQILRVHKSQIFVWQLIRDQDTY